MPFLGLLGSASISDSLSVRTMESQAATKQSRSGLVVRESKLFQEGGRVTASCSRKKCCRVSLVVAALIQGGNGGGVHRPSAASAPDCSELAAVPRNVVCRGTCILEELAILTKLVEL